MVRLLVFLVACTLAACGRAPEIQAALGPEPEGAEYIDLVPLSDILALQTSDPEAVEEADDLLARRAAALRARAAELRSASPE